MEINSKAPNIEVWDEEVLFLDSDAYFVDLLEGIAKAQDSIRFETYIYEPGVLAERVVTALIAASHRGVHVRVLVDGLGSPSFWSTYAHQLKAAQVQVRLFRMWPWQTRWLDRPWFVILYESFRRWFVINRGNHRKTCLIDEQVAWIGSMNISDIHLKEVSGNDAWVDCGVRVRGRELKRLRQAFQHAFKQNFLPSFFQSKKSLLLLNSSLILRKSTKQHQYQKIRRANKRIWIRTPYFVPVPKIYRALIRMARSGVDVRVIVPEQNDVPLVRHLSYAFFSTMLRAGVRIFEFGPRFSHQKVFVIDDWYCVGSTNLNYRSFKHDLEIDVVVTREENREKLLGRFANDQSNAKELTLKSIQNLPLWHKIFSRTLLIFRYWV